MSLVTNLDNTIKNLWPKDGPETQKINKYIKKYSKEKIVIKCGGRVLLDPDLFNNFITDVAILKKLGLTPIVVHGGGPRIKKKLDELNIETKFIMGLRVTDEKVIKVVETVMIEFNKEIVTALIKKGCQSKSINVKENNVISVEKKNEALGFVGNPTKIDDKIIKELIKSNFIPVISPMGLDEKKQTYNINADTAAGSIAKKLKARRLIIMSDVEGVLDSNDKLITEINSDSIKNLIENETITGGMIPKINNCLDVASNGVKGVVIIDGRKNHSLLFELLSDKGSGTLIRK